MNDLTCSNLYYSDDIGLHRVENRSHCDKAVSLHLYSPPYDEACSFDPKTGKSLIAKVTFWSKFGQRTPYVSLMFLLSYAQQPIEIQYLDRQCMCMSNDILYVNLDVYI